MASNADSVTPSSSPLTRTRTCPYDVFLSFRGADTRNNFTGHLHASLVQKGIATFIDDEELRKGEEISSALLRAIQESKISVVVFSENYATSTWCLDELVEILECRKSKQQLVWPVFYKVKVSDVRYQNGRYGEALAKHEGRFKDNMDKVKTWRTALRDAATLSGWTFFDGHEAKFISKIAEDISTQVAKRSYLNVAKYPVGIESRVQDLLELLDVGGNDVRMVGIWGIGGIGKTTIAKAVYNSIARHFEGSCFLGNVRENSEPHGGLVQLQNNLLDEIIGGRKMKMTNDDRGIQVIKERLGSKRVLLVLDDVNELKQLEKLAGASDWFGCGSRIMITTRDKHLLVAHQVAPIYTTKALDSDEACRLLTLNAFKDNRNPDECVQFPIDTAVLFSHGLPLAVNILGSLLCGKSIKQWHAALDSYKKFPNHDIQKVLETSYIALEDPLREAFLDIACLLKGRYKDYVMQALEDSYLNPVHAIDVLEEKALVTTDEFGRIWMHDLLEVMGKEMVRKESIGDAGERSRLWFHEDVCRVLTENTGSSKVKGIRVELPGEEEVCLSAKCFKKMKNLQLFININARFSGEINYLPNQLRFLDWPRFPAQSFPSDFNPRKLVNLNMPNSGISRLGQGLKNLEYLKSLSFKGCRFLTEVPDLSGMFPNLEKLNLGSCTSLAQLHPSVGFLDKLVEFNLRDCTSLNMFPRIVNMKSLRDFNLSGCKRLENLPEIVGRMKSLTSLDVSGTAIKEVPSSIGDQLFNLLFLKLAYCENLTNLPRSIYKLQWLWDLNLTGCPKLMLTPFPNKMKYCEGLSPSSNSKISPCGMAVLSERESDRGGDDQDNLALPLLLSLEAGGCNISDLDFLMTLDCAYTLTSFNCSGSNFVSLDCACLVKFINLEKLYLNGCKRLEEIPELPPNVKKLVVSDCVSLERISKLSKILRRQESQMFKWLDMSNCWRLYDNLVQEAENNGLLVNDDDDGVQVDAYLFSLFLSCHKPDFKVAVSGIHEFPKWFSGQLDFKGNRYPKFEFDIQVLPNFKWKDTGLAFSVAAEELLDWVFEIRINEVAVGMMDEDYLQNASYDDERARVWLHYIPFAVLDMEPFGSQRPLPPFRCRVTISIYYGGEVKRCGVHLVMPPNEEECMKLLHAQTLTKSEVYADGLESTDPDSKLANRTEEMAVGTQESPN